MKSQDREGGVFFNLFFNHLKNRHLMEGKLKSIPYFRPYRPNLFLMTFPPGHQRAYQRKMINVPVIGQGTSGPLLQRHDNKDMALNTKKGREIKFWQYLMMETVQTRAGPETLGPGPGPESQAGRHLPPRVFHGYSRHR